MSLKEIMDKADGGIVLLPGEGKAFSAAGQTIILKATGQDTGGAWSLTEFLLPPRLIEAAPPPHVHTREDEAFFVLEGTVTIQSGNRTIKARAGSFVLSPKGAVHTFSNPEAEPARMQVISSPAGLENFFVELFEVLRIVPPDIPKILETFQKYGMEVKLPG